MSKNKTSGQIEDELDAIRRKHYEETKHLSAKELAKKVNDEARQIAEEYGLNINFVSSAKPVPVFAN